MHIVISVQAVRNVQVVLEVWERQRIGQKMLSPLCIVVRRDSYSIGRTRNPVN